MPITVVTCIQDGKVHGTDNGKKTGCGIKYNTGDNLRKYKSGENISDLVIAMKTLNCEQCRRTLSKKMIKEDRKAENKREKEEQKRIADMIKRGELDEDGNPIVKPEGEEVENTVETPTAPPVEEVAQPVQDTPTQTPTPPTTNTYVAPFQYNQPPIQPVQPPQPIQPSSNDIEQYLEDSSVPQETQEQETFEPISEPPVQPVQQPQPPQPEPVHQEHSKKKPLNDINDILADLDALMSNISSKETTSVNVAQEHIQTPVQEEVVPHVEDLEELEEVSAPVELEPIQEVDEIEEVSAPVELEPIQEVDEIEEVSAPVELEPIQEVDDIEEVSAPVELEPIQEVDEIEEVSAPVELEPIQSVEEVEEVEDTSESVEPIAIPIPVPVQQESTPKVEPVQNTVPPVQPVQNVSPTNTVPTQQQPVSNGYMPPINPQPTYVQPMPMPQAPQFYYNAYGEAIPITYNAQNQPVFTVPVTYDVQGQPRPMQVNQPAMPMPQPVYQQPTTPVVQPPQPTVTTPPPTRVVRADAPPLISKPSESKPFDYSVFEKETKKPVFTVSDNKIFADSIEEALSQLGVETEKEKDDENDVVPEFEEYVKPTAKATPVKKEPEKVQKPELSEKERKKMEKYDAELKKSWAKKGLDPNSWKRMKH